MKQTTKYILIIALLAIIALGTIGTIFIKDRMKTEKFLEEYNAMNGHYKQALYETGQGNKDLAIQEYDAFIMSLQAFEKSYATSRPKKLQGDASFNDDLARTETIASEAKQSVYEGNLTIAHLQLEGIRPIFTDILRRNNLSALSVLLVDFHDSMERVLDAANDKNAEDTIKEYIDADKKLNAVEAELNSTDIQNIRLQLEEIRILAAANNVSTLPAQAVKLKASYVKVYLAQG